MNTVFPSLLMTLAAVTCTVSTAAAETHPALAPGFADSETETTEQGPYSPTIALAAPVLLTAASFALTMAGNETNNSTMANTGLVGLLVAPSAGHLYTGNWGAALLGTGVRTLGVGLFVVGAWSQIPSHSAADDESARDDDGLLVAGGLIFVGGTIYSIVDAPFAAKRENKKHRKLSFSPAPIQGPDRSTGWGAMMQGTF